MHNIEEMLDWMGDKKKSLVDNLIQLCVNLFYRVELE
jgi:hypothetical protein